VSFLKAEDTYTLFQAFSVLYSILKDIPNATSDMIPYANTLKSSAYALINSGELRFVKAALRFLGRAVSLNLIPAQSLSDRSGEIIYALNFPGLREVAAKLIEGLIRSELEVDTIKLISSIEDIMDEIYKQPYCDNIEQTILKLLFTLLQSNASVQISLSNRLFSILFKLARYPQQHIKVNAAGCIAILYSQDKVPESYQNMLQWIVTGLSKLVSNSDCKTDVCQILTKLMKNREDLQKLCGQIGVLNEVIVDFLKMYSSLEQQILNCPSDMQDLSLFRNLISSLYTISAITDLHEPNRQFVIENSGLIESISKVMGCNIIELRLAACRCYISLSRSIKRIKSIFIESGIADTVMKLLSDSSTQVQVSAASIMNNILVDFSDLQLQGLVEKLCELTGSSNDELRHISTCAIKNLVYKSKRETKKDLMRYLTYDRLLHLSNDSLSVIQEQALCIFRNLLFCEEEDIEFVLSSVHSQLLDLIISKLSSSFPRVVSQSLYVIANIASGNESHKSLIIESPILPRILELISLPEVEIRIASAFCLLNLCWGSGASSEAPRLQRLVELGVRSKLECINEDEDMKVKSHVSRALELLKEL
jgi:hypothetical protein